MSNFQGIHAALRLMAVAALSLLVVFSASAQTVRYIHTDALGSPVLVTDKDRNVIEHSEYEPYGSLLNRPIVDGPGYTGHIMDATTGLTYMQQRYYDPLLGVFLSVDPVTAYDGDLNHFNRYSYAVNNPYGFIDPDGRKGKVAWLVELGSTQLRKVARLTQEQAVRARRAEKNIVADRRQVASKIETAAHGRDGQLKHAAHELEDGEKGLPHYQTDGVRGHSFWGKLGVGMFAIAGALDKAAEAADLLDPTVSLTSGSGDIVNHRKTWYGAYEQIDPNGPNFFQADAQRARSQGFQGVFRVEGRIEAKQLDKKLNGK